jgi:CHC2 zinc finger
MIATIDLRDLASRTNLRRLIEEDRGQPNGSRRYLCPFHDDHSPDLGIDTGSNRWRCWACGASGDAIDWLTGYRKMSTIEAARYLGADIDEKAPGSSAKRPASAGLSEHTTGNVRKPQELPAWSSEAWQGTVDRIICEAALALRSEEGRSALSWLRWRGLEYRTIHLFRLGFIPATFETEPFDCLPLDPDGNPQGICAARGIVFPYALPGSWYSPHEKPPLPRWAGANVRRLPETDVFAKLPKRTGKCMAFRGTERGHLYPHPTIEAEQGGLPGVVVEGEIDSLIGWQEAGHVVHFGTVGGSNSDPKQSALDALSLCPHWLIATDHDDPGIAAALKWMERSPDKSHRSVLPFGKDLGEFHQSGGNVLEWIKAEHQRLGWTWPLAR